jgi:hypothetical protein
LFSPPRELPPTLRALPQSLGAVDTAAAQIDPAARSLLPAARALAPALVSLQRLSPVAVHALDALDHPLPELTSLLRSATPPAGNLQRAFALLRPQAPQIDHVTAEAANVVTLADHADVLEAGVKVGSVSARSPPAAESPPSLPRPRSSIRSSQRSILATGRRRSNC